mmetsp:Transcript_37973/g.76716  ORF Transcript_37973/g.76716 Transcript_37973/m.76716 type:complete len:144 (+) Transcript_37973:788-1219(+)
MHIPQIFRERTEIITMHPKRVEAVKARQAWWQIKQMAATKVETSECRHVACVARAAHTSTKKYGQEVHFVVLGIQVSEGAQTNETGRKTREQVMLDLYVLKTQTISNCIVDALKAIRVSHELPEGSEFAELFGNGRKHVAAQI